MPSITYRSGIFRANAHVGESMIRKYRLDNPLNSLSYRIDALYIWLKDCTSRWCPKYDNWTISRMRNHLQSTLYKILESPYKFYCPSTHIVRLNWDAWRMAREKYPEVAAAMQCGPPLGLDRHFRIKVCLSARPQRRIRAGPLQGIFGFQSILPVDNVRRIRCSYGYKVDLDQDNCKTYNY